MRSAILSLAAVLALCAGAQPRLAEATPPEPEKFDESGFVKIFDGKSGNFLSQLLAYEANAKVGVQIASGDVNGDGSDDVITAPGPGIATEVRVYSGATLRLLGSFTPFGADYSSGATVAAADLNFDGRAEIVVGSGKGRSPEIRVFDGTTALPSALLLPKK